MGEMESQSSSSSSSSKTPRWDLLILLFAIGNGPGEALLFLLCVGCVCLGEVPNRMEFILCTRADD